MMFVMKDFHFYLDAAAFCREHGIPYERIVRKNWKIWTVKKGAK
jgi:hypothetical protein